MTALPLLPVSRRLRRLAALLLLALVLVTGVALSMTRPFGARAIEQDDPILPSIRLVHEITAAVDELRGLAALHLLHADAAERLDLEMRLKAGRLKVERRMAVSTRRLADAVERDLHWRVRVSLQAFWTTQDRLLAASRLGADEPAAANQARALMAGDSQQAYQRLRTDLEAWWAYTDELASRAVQARASQASLLQGLLVLQGALALGLAACAMLAVRASRSTPKPPGDDLSPGPAAGRHGDSALDSLAVQTHLLALEAAVVAARAGDGTAHDGGPAVRRIAQRLEATAADLHSLAGRRRPAAGPDRDAGAAGSDGGGNRTDLGP